MKSVNVKAFNLVTRINEVCKEKIFHVIINVNSTVQQVIHFEHRMMANVNVSVK